MVTVSIEAFSRAMPTLVLACSREDAQGEKFDNECPRTAMQPTLRLQRAMKMCAPGRSSGSFLADGAIKLVLVR